MKRLIFGLLFAALDIFLAINYLSVGDYWHSGLSAVLAIILIVVGYDFWKRELKQ